jgi:hypothetical protein
LLVVGELELDVGILGLKRGQEILETLIKIRTLFLALFIVLRRPVSVALKRCCNQLTPSYDLDHIQETSFLLILANSSIILWALFFRVIERTFRGSVCRSLESQHGLIAAVSILLQPTMRGK